MLKKQPKYKKAWYAIAVMRIMIGFIFLWAFFDKLLGLGFATSGDKSWLSGSSPTTGFLQFGVNPDSPFASMFNSLAGLAWVDWLFMLGLLGIGLALVLGIGVRLAAVTGSIMLILMWLALLPLENNPIIDDHVVYVVALAVVALSRRELSLVDWWLGFDIVKKNPWLW